MCVLAETVSIRMVRRCPTAVIVTKLFNSSITTETTGDRIPRQAMRCAHRTGPGPARRDRGGFHEFSRIDAD